jgi:hypothetical protein
VADALVLSGVLHLVEDRNNEAAKDFLAALRLENDESTLLLQFVALRRMGRASDSELKAWEPGGGFILNPYIDGMDATLLFVQGNLTADELLEKADHGRGRERLAAISWAHWVFAEQARWEGDHEAEVAHLAEVLDLEQFTELSYLLAMHRERQMRWEAIRRNSKGSGAE